MKIRHVGVSWIVAGIMLVACSEPDGSSGASLPQQKGSIKNYSCTETSSAPVGKSSQAGYRSSARIMEAFEFCIQQPMTAGNNFSLQGQYPDGMTISGSGLITWTPTPDQTGDHTVNIAYGSVTKSLRIDVTSGSESIVANAYFISSNADRDTNDRKKSGDYQQPFTDTRYLCNHSDITNVSVIYYRGGVYHNPGFGSGEVDNDSIPNIECSGTESSRLIIRPWGNERPTIHFDSLVGIRLRADFVIFEGFTIRGITQDITYQQAVANWWQGNKYFNGNGIVIDGAGVLVRNNIIYDIPGAGINTGSGADLLSIENNIIFNASWWNIKGTTGIGLVGIDNSSLATDPSAGDYNIKVRNNLVFSSESRIFSRVYSKGFAHLVIDEGSTMLIKIDNGSYSRGYLIENNAFLYNGKGVSLRADSIAFINNTMYNNGTTIAGNGSGLRSNGGTNMILNNNAVQAIGDKNAVDFSDAVTLQSCSGNLFRGGFLRPQTCENAGLNTIVDQQLFGNPDALDFSLATGIGVTGVGVKVQTLEAHIATLRERFGMDLIQPTGYKVDVDSQRQSIVQSVSQNFPAECIIQPIQDSTHPDYKYEITCPDSSNVTGKNKFYLEW